VVGLRWCRRPNGDQGRAQFLTTPKRRGVIGTWTTRDGSLAPFIFRRSVIVERFAQASLVTSAGCLSSFPYILGLLDHPRKLDESIVSFRACLGSAAMGQNSGMRA
jgi:hypothetical protein